MFIVAGVAGVTICWSAEVDMINVAGLASRSDMRPGQFEGGQVVIEESRDPASHLMAGSAVGAKTTQMDVIAGVAGEAVGGGVRKYPVGVAGFTGNGGMFTEQSEGGLVMVEDGGNPAGSRMTIPAIGTKRSQVDIIIGMAGDAAGGRRAQIRDRAGIHVASQAGGTGVLSGQLERKKIVVEEAAEGVDPIVADQAIGPEGENMTGDEGGIFLLMAGLADGRIEGGEVRAVAVSADERQTAGGKRMTGQRVTEQFMRKMGVLEICKGGSDPAMIGVTIPANQGWVALDDRPVQGGRIGEMHGNINMAGSAAGIHASRIPKRGMAKFALSAKFSVRGVAAERLPGLGIERPGAEHHASFQEGDDGDDDDGQSGCDQTGRGKKAKAGILHCSRLKQERGVIECRADVNE
jgi:hypothetical protein